MSNLKYFFLSFLVLAALALTSSCDVSSSNILSSLTSTVSRDAQGNLWATLSSNLSVADYRLAEMNLPVLDPENPTAQYGSIAITPVLCTVPTRCAESLLTLTLNLTALEDFQFLNTNLPNGTAFPVTFPLLTHVVALPIGNGGGRVYAAIGGGVSFLGVAIPFEGLHGAGRYTPGLNVFTTSLFDGDLIKSYFGCFAGAGSQQTGVGLFADISKLVGSQENRELGLVPLLPAMPSLPGIPFVSQTPVTSYLQETSNRSETEQQKFLYQLWKLGHDRHPVLQYSY